MKLNVSHLCIAALFLIPAVCSAERCAGHNINYMLAWDANEMTKGTTITTFRHTSVTVSDNPSALYHLIAGECGGTLLSTPDGNFQAWGHCSRKDKDGDVLNEAWTVPPGTALKGTFKFIGGTGKFANYSGSANLEVIMNQGKMAAVRWTGTCN
jgi:hypothetical protein